MLTPTARDQGRYASSLELVVFQSERIPPREEYWPELEGLLERQCGALVRRISPRTAGAERASDEVTPALDTSAFVEQVQPLLVSVATKGRQVAVRLHDEPIEAVDDIRGRSTPVQERGAAESRQHDHVDIQPHERQQPVTLNQADPLTDTQHRNLQRGSCAWRHGSRVSVIPLLDRLKSTDATRSSNGNADRCVLN